MQFINYIVVPSNRAGKFDKLPVDPRTGNVCNAQDPDIWTDYDTARARSDQVGFVFTQDDPFFFLDIDSCATNSGWSPLALELCALLPGAAIEISHSGRGLHVFGVGKVPLHACRGPAGTGLELYTEGRFVALSMLPQHTAGNILTDCTQGIQAVVDRYFQPRRDVLPAAQWSTGPCEGWRGSVDDDELLRRALASKSAASIFGAKASFEDLWTNNAPVLNLAYPDAMTGQGYDASAVDAALAQHLAFWTGKDCARMLKLMMRSGLVRDKWQRDDYLTQRTIPFAVAHQKEVCQDKLPEPVEPVGQITEINGATYINTDQQKIIFEGCIYIAKQDVILMPGGHSWSEKKFNSLLGGLTFIIDKSNAKTTPDAWKAFLHNQVLRFPRAHDTEFRPDLPPGHIWREGNNLMANSYYPIPVIMTKGDVSLFLNHLKLMLPVERDRTILLSWMAAVVQHLGVKFKWSPLVQGVQGNGKTMLSECLVYAVGRELTHPALADQLTKNFNKWQVGKVLITVEDVYVPESKGAVLEALKPMITENHRQVEGKGIDQLSRKLCCNFFLNSNHKDAIRIGRNDRRLSALYTAQQSYADILKCGMDNNYFSRLYGWLENGGYAKVAHYLKFEYQIPKEFNPALGNRAPETSSSEASFTMSLGRLEQEIVNAIQEEKIGFRCGWISSHYLDMLIKDVGMDRLVPRNKRKDVMETLNYRPHAGLIDGRTNNPVQPDGTKPRLYVIVGHRGELLQGSDVADMYTQDQLTGGVIGK